jgi:hypothetical protein
MIGRNPLLVAKEHGHRLTTMFSVYVAWTEGALEADIVAIRDAMNRRDSTGSGAAQALPETPARPEQPVARPESQQAIQRSTVPLVKTERPHEARFGSRFASRSLPLLRNPLKSKEIYGGKGGTRTLDPGIMSSDQILTEHLRRLSDKPKACC